MIRPSRTSRLAVVAAAAALILTSCGGGDDDADATDGDTTTDTPTSDTTSSEPSGQPTGDGVLHVGTFLPQTGDLAYLGPPEFAGVDLAIKEINDAGGVLGKPVEQT